MTRPITTPTLDASRPSNGSMQLSLLGRWQLRRDGVPVNVPAGAQRLVALPALWGPKPRAAVAGTLWPERTEQHALGSLRTTLWRLQSAGVLVFAPDRGCLALAPGVFVDVHEFMACAPRAARGEVDPGGHESAVVLGSDELLPGWYDDWVLRERERIHQMRLHALEGLSDRLLRLERHADALEAALAAVAAEPLRESARRAAMRVHLAERNATEAVRQYVEFRGLLRSELGVEPSAAMTVMVRPYIPASHEAL